VHCGDVLVNPGDLVFADFDGIVVVPTIVEKEVMRLAAEKIQNENYSRKELMEGKTLREVYDKYKSL
jgi:regulator of RNase E activity RraA